MSKDTSGMNIYQKLAAIRKAVDILQKDEDGFGYKYVSEAQLLPLITAKMDQLGLTLVPQIQPGTMSAEPYSYQKGYGEKIQTVNEFLVRAETSYTWVNNDNPEETLHIPWAIVGNQSDSSQAFGAALTYGERYFLLKFFQSATVEDDPDKIRTEQRRALEKTDINSVLSQVDAIVQDVVAKHPKRRDEIKAVISKHVDKRDADGNLVATGDYFQIKKKARAMALLKELQEKFQQGESAVL